MQIWWIYLRNCLDMCLAPWSSLSLSDATNLLYFCLKPRFKLEIITLSNKYIIFSFLVDLLSIVSLSSMVITSLVTKLGNKLAIGRLVSCAYSSLILFRAVSHEQYFMTSVKLNKNSEVFNYVGGCVKHFISMHACTHTHTHMHTNVNKYMCIIIHVHNCKCNVLYRISYKFVWCTKDL